jgi:hypothetical protein
MKKFLALSVIITSFASLALTTVACGKSPCDELDERCDSCDDFGSSTSCSFAVAFDDDDACQSVLDDADFNQHCK